MVGILVADNVGSWMTYLQQFGEGIPFTFVAPHELNTDIEMLLIPPTNVFAGYESFVLHKSHLGEHYPEHIDSLIRWFFEKTLEQYITHEVKVLALGNSADMLWVALGGMLQVNKEEGGPAYLLGNHATSPLVDVNPKLGTGFSFHHSACFDESFFKLVNRPTTVFPVAWKYWSNRSVYKSKITTAEDVLSEVRKEHLPLVAFEHVSGKFMGLKENPMLITHRPGSEIRRRYNLKYGSALAAAMLKHLLYGPFEPSAGE